MFGAAAGDNTKTVTLQLGVKSINATGYGNPITYAPESRPDQAMDGDLRTAWTVDAFANPVGQYLRITLDHPTTTDTVNLVQPLYGSRNRWITKATLRFDGGRPMVVDLGPVVAHGRGTDHHLPYPLLHHVADHDRRHQHRGRWPPTTGSRGWASPRCASPGNRWRRSCGSPRTC